MPTRSVLFCDRELDVDRGEEGEDVGLEDGHQDFEQGEGEAEGERSGSKGRPPPAQGEEEELRRRESWNFHDVEVVG